MRRNLLHVGYKELSYEIREIVEVANKISEFGVEIFWENIGDPVEKGEKLPDWIKGIITDSLKNDAVYGYSPSKGLLHTREYLASKNPNITAEDIIFFNGLGEAINKVYGYLAFSARVLGPNPAYPTHSSAEATNSGSEHQTYNLDPDNEWNPNLEEIESKVKYNPNISGILVINPDNPTGAVFKKEVLEGIIDIARRYKLFVIFDEIYENLVFNKADKVMLKDIIAEVPGISMQGMSKSLPWPGARCGWIEIYNQNKDENFKKYIHSVYFSKMLEVCSTTLPQYVLPLIYEDPRFEKYIDKRVQKYKKRAKIAKEIFGESKGIKFVEPKGAYYLSIVFDMDKINTEYVPDLLDRGIKKYLTLLFKNKPRFDKRFCYNLLAISGVCTVPLSGFNSNYDGFRITLLEEDEVKFREILFKIRDFIQLYIS